MSRMKHLLRKLHIGGGGGGGSSSGGVDHQTHHHPHPHPHPHHHQRLVGDARRNPSPASASSSRATAQDAAPAEAVEVRDGSRSDGAAAIAGSDFSLFEEEYQVQLALAISASADPDGLEDADSVQIKAAKRMSLGCPPGVGAASGTFVGVGADDDSSMELLSLRYWSYNVVNYDEKLLDGFYDVYGVISNPSIIEKMPSLVDLQAISVSDKIDYEVILVNRTFDYTLQQLEKQAVSILLESKTEEHGLLASELVQRIADLVVRTMGGPVDDANDMQRRWTLKSCELRNSLNTIVLPLGSLEIGLSRHRALLFKVLADRINLPCKLVKGSYYTGTDEGAVNFIKVDYESEYIVDLMGAPGTLIPTENPNTHMENSRNFLLDPETIEQTVKDLCLAINKVNFQFERKSDTFEGDLDNSLPSGYSELQLEDSSSLINRYDDVDGLVVNSHITGCDNEPGNFHPLLSRPPLVTSKPTEVISPSQQMKVNDVSKYVVTAAKNPEFAQKLHAVLLESGASPPPDLFSDLSSSLNLVEQDHNIGFEATDGRIRLELAEMNTSTDIKSSISPVLTAECSIDSDMAKKNENVAERLVNNMGEEISGTSMSSSLATTNDWLVIPNSQVNVSSLDGSWVKYSDSILDYPVASGAFFLNEVDACPVSDVAESIQKGGANILGPSVVHYYQENIGRDSVSDGHQVAPEDRQEGAKDSMFKLKGNLHGLYASDNEKSSKILDAVSEWEIPWEDLQIGERIGLGSYGEVYRADWNCTEVAVKKFLDQDLYGDALEQFRYEVKIMSRLRHPNVVLFMGAVTRPPNLSILTEFLPRGSLYRLLHRPNTQLDEKRRLKMALDVAKGMNYLHTSHPTIVHRDLKSPNLLVDKNWVVKVCDFGLSRLKHHTFLSSKSTSGTPEWMAPEVLRNEPSNEKCDVYSFGVILWELATLHKPWSGMNSMQVVGAVGFQNRRLEIPNDIDPVVAQIITDCWESEPNKRPSFAQLLTPLKQLQKLVGAN
ncbi:probable serine/threonine-protein kinase SIS8 [Zingiber officinale]|uniref:probable serine/threonine-protein kinase SIS8 n=1 Tax=Zingiber officinale TaxID=94328 RepID=UPI001C4D0E6F|nr:probable serine/threonine-protein kinase SIS8 [Zingiber officinale]